MTVNEFSNQFDVLYNNITSNQAPGLNEYEKSVFLTKAQDEIVKNYFNPKSNPKQEGFDDTAKRQADFATLIEQKELVKVSNPQSKFDKRALVYKYPNSDGKTDVFIVLNEQIQDDSFEYVVVPISYDEYNRVMSKPYKYPPKYQAWRLITNKDGEIPTIEIIGKFKDNVKYTMRYVKRPKPIVLVNLTDDSLTIEDAAVVQNCELPNYLHEEILQRAVELAKIAWEGSAQSAITAGARSE